MTAPSAYDADATQIATRVLYELTGRRWVWPAITTTETVWIPPWPNTIILQGRPVISVASVVRLYPDGTTADQPFVVENGHIIRLTAWTQIANQTMLLGDPSFLADSILQDTTVLNPAGLWQPYAIIPQREIAVTYTYGSPPPFQLGYAIEVLANELMLAMTGDSACRLPDRVTSISRQGMAISMLPPEQFLDAGHTGIPEVDTAIRIFNAGQAKRPARVYSPTSPPARRTNTTQALVAGEQVIFGTAASGSGQLSVVFSAH